MNRRSRRTTAVQPLDHSVAVVVPAFNEATRIGRVLATIPSYVETVIVIDDGSTDETAELAERVDGVVVVRHTTNRGVGAALTTGYRVALELGADIVAVMAGDGQMEPDELWALVAPIARGELDYVKGDRISHPDVTRRMPWVRRLGTQALARLTRRVAGAGALPRLNDAQCGYTAIASNTLKRLPLERLYPRSGYPNALPGMLGVLGARVGERTVSPVYAGEASGLRPSRALVTHSFVLVRAALWRLSVSTRW